MGSSFSCHSSVLCCHYSSEIGAGMKLQKKDIPRVTDQDKSVSLLCLLAFIHISLFIK